MTTDSCLDFFSFDFVFPLSGAQQSKTISIIKNCGVIKLGWRQILSHSCTRSSHQWQEHKHKYHSNKSNLGTHCSGQTAGLKMLKINAHAVQSLWKNVRMTSRRSSVGYFWHHKHGLDPAPELPVLNPSNYMLETVCCLTPRLLSGSISSMLHIWLMILTNIPTW